jgi:hypothetical protein
VGTEEFVTHLESSSRSIEPGARSFVEVAPSRIGCWRMARDRKQLRKWRFFARDAWHTLPSAE